MKQAMPEIIIEVTTTIDYWMCQISSILQKRKL